MGVRVYDTDDDELSSSTSATIGTASSSHSTIGQSGDSCNGCSKCLHCSIAMEQHFKLPAATAAAASQAGTNHTPHHIAKDLVGNGKEYRMDGVNRYDLRIIGNGNRVRITSNVGSVQIIGNATRLKINANSGSIKYTGNDGRICLGTDSTQQFVDYIGCNGILKICNSTEWPTMNLPKKPHKQHKSDVPSAKATGGGFTARNGNACKHTAAAAAKTTATAAAAATPILIAKSASYAGADWAQYQWMMGAAAAAELPTHNSARNMNKNFSLPNLRRSHNKEASAQSAQRQQHCRCNCKCADGGENRADNYQHVVHNTIGSIVIKNAVNVTI